VKVLVTGGAGYIGSHLVRALLGRGDEAVVVDDLETGDAERIPGVPLLRLDLASDEAPKRLREFLREHRVEAAVHFAALKQVGESVAQPARYYRQNIGSLANLLLALEDAGVDRLLFSSSAAVYAPSETLLTEESPTRPMSPYGETKLAGERLVTDAANAWGLRPVSLRYFNVAGAASPELADTAVLNLIPMVIEKLDAGKPPLIFGDDYDTPDGTCIRDYVHVQDVAEAHLAALDALADGTLDHRVYNIGTGTGHSVREIIDAVLAEAGSDLTAEVVARRPGDPATVVAAVDRIREELGWIARHTLHDIISSSWESHGHHRKAGRP
jgi:UDP-glucose 4-epimerase